MNGTEMMVEFEDPKYNTNDRFPYLGTALVNGLDSLYIEKKIKPLGSFGKNRIAGCNDGTDDFKLQEQWHDTYEFLGAVGWLQYVILHSYTPLDEQKNSQDMAELLKLFLPIVDELQKELERMYKLLDAAGELSPDKKCLITSKSRFGLVKSDECPEKLVEWQNRTFAETARHVMGILDEIKGRSTASTELSV